MKIKTKHFLLVTFFLLSCTSLTYAQYSNLTIKNASGQPLGLINISGDNGGDLATLYITGVAASFGDNQRLMHGSGYIQAVPDKGVSIVLKMRYKKKGDKEESINLISFDVNRIDWDFYGNTTHISGISPTMDDWFGNKLQIKSDLQNPLLVNGILSLDVEKIGKISINIKFGGRGIPFDPSFPSVCSKILGDKVFVY